MVADDLGPVIVEVDIGLAPDPRHRSRISDQRAGEAAIDGEADLPAREWLSSDVHARDTQSGCVVRAVVVRVRIVAQVSDTNSCFGEKRGRKDVVVVHTRAVGRLDACAFKAASCGTAQKRSKGRRLKGVDSLPAVASAEMVLLIDRPVDLCIEAVRALGERKIGGVVVGRISQRCVRVQSPIRRQRQHSPSAES